MIKFWKKILDELNNNINIVLLTVVENKGSSPGRQGFKMYVTSKNEFHGSIGGGSTEYQLVNKAKKILANEETKPSLIRQVHNSDEEMHKSGMICSGEHTVAMQPFNFNDIHFVETIIDDIENNKAGIFQLSNNGFEYTTFEKRKEQYYFSKKNESEWSFSEYLGYKNIINIIGGGHVGLSLSVVMKQLGFYVIVYDNRKDLNTFIDNNIADEKHIVDYKDIDKIIPEGKNIYTVIMSFSHINDGFILHKLVNHDIKYLGLMGSAKKVKTIFADLEEKGVSKSNLDKIYAPIGIQIKSETPEEIAISVAAEIIKTKNMGITKLKTEVLRK